MQIQLSNEEKDLFETISKSSTGTILQGYIEKIIRTVESVRTNTTLSNEARIEVANLLEELLVNKIKMNRGELQKPLNNEFE